MTYRVIGSAYEGLHRMNEGVEYYHRALELMDSVKDDDSHDFWFGMHVIRWGLYQIKLTLERRVEAVGHLRKSLEKRESKLAENPRELAFVYMELAEQYVSVKNFKEALPFGLKALDMHVKLGSNPHIVALARTCLGMIYSGLGEHTKASEQHELSDKVLRWDGSYDSLVEKVDVAKELIDEGRCVEPMAALLVPVNSAHLMNRPEAKNDLEL
ncbi:OLC1v1001629C1 [Oldenlandia corymbosa var. corymbosa]|uniref:OLC1v1001629C1 n=1 Tax=Oldenlandia corymbosa var. corymbosa TaxID=529605 RepID=A0AAV1D8I3_OLDCO|nr:OLC1v1001629C1 [Oldenlandia corymbosa var. corymbosa]